MQTPTTIILLTLLILPACQMNKNTNTPDTAGFTFFVGTYTQNQNPGCPEPSQGIYAYQLEQDGSLTKIGLAAKSVNPSFLARSADGEFLIAVNEVSHDGAGTVESYRIHDDSLEFINRSSSGGAHPCFVSVNENGYVIAANYSGGNVGLLRLTREGRLSALLDVQQHHGSGSHPRQEAPHAHSAWFDPVSEDIMSVDLGTNSLWISRLDTASQSFTPSGERQLNMTAGAGPRHLAFHPMGKWIYVLNELDNTVSIVDRLGDGYLQTRTSISTLPAAYANDNAGADIHLSSDGLFLYTSNRGHNSIAIFSVDVEDGSLTANGHQSTHGETPRNFAMSPDDQFLVVAHQSSNNIVSFKRDKATGTLEYLAEITAPAPVCILF